MGNLRSRRFVCIACICVYGLSLLLIHGSVPGGVRREALRINGPDDRPCLATLWLPPAPKAVLVLGHGVSSNQGVMAAIARAYARNGYAVVALDFWGHGFSRERFDWSSNAAQLLAWFDWARMRFPLLPLAYMGHSMGGAAGDAALAQGASLDAFISLGMLPRRLSATQTLIAAGRFEELFTPEQARRRAGDAADVLISPYSNHALETWDPVLIRDMTAWTDAALGIDGAAVFPWAGFLAALLGVALGSGAALALAGCALIYTRYPPRAMPEKHGTRRWSVNPYRIVGRLLGCGGQGPSLRTTAPLYVTVFQGALYSALVIVLLSPVLANHMYSYALLHPGRWLTWLVLFPFLAPIIILDVWIFERLAIGNTWKRFAVAALTRGAPLVALAIGLRYVPGLSFPGMMLGIGAFIFIVLSLVHALAARGARDYRAGAVASAALFVWVIAFWFPLVLG